MIYNLDEHKIVETKELGLCGFISFERLVQTFKECGELKPNERIEWFEVTERGLTFKVEYE